MTILLVSSLFLFKDISRFLISSFQEKADISVYFKSDTPELDILNLKEEISKIPEAKSVEYVSKEEALQEFTERHKDDPVLMESLEEVGGNPLLASLNIKAFEADQYQAISNFLDESPSYKNLIEKVDYYQRKSIIENIFSITSAFNKVGIGLSLILVMVAILVVFNTIRLAIINYREEIKIQRLVGASSWFIRGPFLVQGTISGIFSALICLLIFTLICWFFSPKLEILLTEPNLWSYFTASFWIIVLIQFATGIGLGVISSAIASRKYLKI